MQTQTLTQTPAAAEEPFSLLGLAAAKRLAPEFLRGLGLTGCSYRKQPAVRVPYTDAEGVEAAVRYRLALTGARRFVWRAGDKTLPYGVERIPKAGWIVLVEGESDCWTLWQHGFPALGIPGKSTWRPEWARLVAGLEVYVWEEPGAEDFSARIARDVPGVLVMRAPDGVKDVSEKHVALAQAAGSDDGLAPEVREMFAGWFAEQQVAAQTPAALAQGITRERLVGLELAAADVLSYPDPLEIVEHALRRMGYGGDIRAPLIVYLAATSRLIARRAGAMPVHLILIGPPSSGKSYAVNSALALLPDASKHVIAAGTPHVLIYDDADLRHVAVVVGEADSLPTSEDGSAASAIRNLCQDGYLHYDSIVKDETGGFTTQTIEKEGPTVLITTAVRRLGEQMMTRLFSLEVDDTPAQVEAAIRAQARIELCGADSPDEALIAYQELLQLSTPWEVYVPFAGDLAEAILGKNPAPRLTRDFARLICLVKAVAVLRHRWRRRDEQDRVIAERADYATVRELVNDMYVATASEGCSQAVRDVIRVVGELYAEDKEAPITASRVAAALGIAVSSASRRAKAALGQGWLVNLEMRSRQPLRLAPGDPLPEAVGLPDLGGEGDPPPVTPDDEPPAWLS